MNELTTIMGHSSRTMSDVTDVLTWIGISIGILVASCCLCCCVGVVMRRPGGWLEKPQSQVRIHPHTIIIGT